MLACQAPRQTPKLLPSFHMAKQGKLQITIEYVAARVILAVLSRLPVSLSMTIGRGIGRLAYVFASHLRRTASTKS
jgi:lauroyl/myristoyl acyltransferase